MVNRNNGETRWDHEVIFELIPRDAAVLDLGCGKGELLRKLIDEKNVWGMGVERNLERVVGSVENDVPVYHADLDRGLPQLPEKFFDYVILEKTLQAVNRPLDLLDEMLRLGKLGIISFLNFGYKEVIDSFIANERMPITETLPYGWYDTPNIHLFTAKDFLDMVKEKNINIEMGRSWIHGGVRPFKESEARDAEEILFVISRN